ncbi:FAD-dependent oxidoreductase [Stieleria mannarensis]|uniref:FAD-dependent oxidoreductase n=1 Tax=Stieleria mannarensis TaxID=2755585 RepID=UPI0016029036|nr:FAD-dependent oxidoreductase [Rhodopirellula sp. JC639]
MTESKRRQFLKTAAVLGPAGLLVNRNAIASDNEKPIGSVPDAARGHVLRTSGQLTESDSELQENSRHLPVAGHSQVLVCGGGPAGIAAALAAARSGATVQLLELAGCLGGVWTAGMLTKILDVSGKSGIMQEVLAALAARGSDVAKRSAGTVYDPELAKVVLEEMCVEAGVKIQLHTMVVGAVTDESNRLVAVITESKSGRQGWTADRFIDCTGDGDLAAQAGCRFDLGFGEDCTCQPMSMMALVTGPRPEDVQEFIRETGREAKARLYKFMQDAGINPSYRAPTLRHLHSGIYSIMTNHQYGVSAFDAGAITKATIEGRREVHEIVRGLRDLGGVWKDLAVVATAEQIGIREGRRIKGRYTITSDDITTGLKHPQAVCRSKFSIDVHSLEIAGNPESIEALRARGVRQYDIPYPALVAADVDGLLMAGRCISGDFFAHASYRVTGNAVPMGEAAGKAAAASIDQGIMPHELTWNTATSKTNS